MVKKYLFPLLFLCCLIVPGAEAVKATRLEQFTLPDGSVQISWLTDKPQKGAYLIVTGASGSKLILPEITGFDVRNHAIIIPKEDAPGATVVLSRTMQEKDVLFPAMKIVPPPKIETKEFKVPLLVGDPAAPRQNYPVRSGVPFAKGALGSAADAMLTDAAGNPVECRFETLSKWPDGSVKWLIVNFNANTKAGETLKLFVQKRTKPAADVATAKFDELKKILSALRCEITFGDGKTAVAELKDHRIVRQNPIPGGIRIEYRAKFNGKGGCILHAVCTLHAERIAVDHRIISLRATKVEEVKSIVWRGFPKCGAPDFTRRQLYADVPHDNGFFPCGNYTVYVPDFWQQWPKGATNKNGEFTYEMLPPLPEKGYLPEKLSSQQIFCRYFWYREGGLYAFRHHLALPGVFTVIFNSKTAPEKLQKQCEAPLFAASTPGYYCSTGVFGPVYPADGKTFPDAEKCFAESFYNHRKTQEMISDYGWMSWGDWFGERVDNWGNNEYDLAYTAIIQFARTGNLDYLKRGVEMARHYSAVDVCHDEKRGRTPEMAYAHCIGHTGLLLDPKGKLAARATHHHGYFGIYHDRNGGHNFLSGSYFASALTGDRMMYDEICRACIQQAVYMSVDVQIPIERSVGWFLINQTNAYNFTSNPLHLNAARLIVDKIVEKQNPKTGCLDLPTDQSECRCPDRKKHRSGKAFAMGVLMHGMRFYHEITGEKRAATSLIRSANWLMTDCYDPINRKFRYKTGCPNYFYGGSFETIATEGIAYAGILTGERKYAEFIRDHLGPEIRTFRAGTPTKTFAMEWRLVPHTLYYLKAQGITELTKHAICENPKGKPGVYWMDAVDFASQSGGKVFVRGDKNTPSGGKCFSHWDKKGHSVTWKYPALPAGRYHFGICYSAGKPVSREVRINGKVFGSFRCPPSGGLGERLEDWKTPLFLDEKQKPVVLQLDGKPFELTLVNDCNQALNLDFLWFQKER